MGRKIKISDAEQYGIRIDHGNGKIGWIVGPDGNYLLFDTEEEAAKALRKMKKDDRYSWNCDVQVTLFHR